MILFKHPEKQRDFARIDTRLREIVQFMDAYAYSTWRDDLVVTSIFRDDPNSVHAYGRGIDLALLIKGNSEQLRRIVNQKFDYDLARPELETIPALRHGTAPHFHVQVRAKED